MCVCLSVKSHLTSGASVRPENAVTYSAGNEGQKICGVFSETAPLQRSGTSCIVWLCAVGHFPAESASVCLCVDDYSRTTGYEAAYERYQQLQCYKGMKTNVAILLKRLRSRDMA